MDFIKEYVSEQVALGRMTGPYSKAQVEHILGSPFVSSPLIVIPKEGSDKFRLIQNFSYKGDQEASINDEIDSDDFPTTWGTAAQVAELVSVSLLHPSVSLPDTRYAII